MQAGCDTAIKVGDRVWCDLFTEYYCDTTEVIHCHLEPCPVCGAGQAATDQYCSPFETIEEGGALCCEECGSEFKLLSYEFFRTDQSGEDAELEVVAIAEGI